MSDFRYIDFSPRPPRRRYAATIGLFDGLHRGHRYLLEQLRQVAANRHLDTAVVTFADHPRCLLGHPDAPSLLTPLDEKIALLSESGVHRCILLDFSPEMAQCSAETFLCDYLRGRFDIDLLLVGHDHRFGRPRLGEGFAEYVEYGRRVGIEVQRASRYAPSDVSEVIASSVVRRLLAEGKVAEAWRLLGRPYTLSGMVVEGRRNGRKLGFPTANLRLDSPRKLLPRIGVYAVYVDLDNRRYCAMTNIGRRPTLDNGTDITIETHLLDFDQNLYGRQLTLQFIERIRDEKRHSSLAALVQQLQDDARQTRLLLSSSSPSLLQPPC